MSVLEFADRLGHMASTPTKAFLSGRLVVSQTGKDPWGMLLVPQALVDGLFASLDEHGVEKSPNRAHISVFTDEELNKIGQDKITERGKSYEFTLGSVRHVRPRGWKNYDRCWFVACHSHELEKLRVSYGLTPRPNNQQFHITFAVREAPAKTAGVNAALALSAIGGGLGGLADHWRNRNDDEHVTRRRPWLARHAGLVSGLTLGGATGATSRPLVGALQRLRKMAPKPSATPQAVAKPAVDPLAGVSLHDIIHSGIGGVDQATLGIRPEPAPVAPKPEPKVDPLEGMSLQDIIHAGIGGVDQQSLGLRDEPAPVVAPKRDMVDRALDATELGLNTAAAGSMLYGPAAAGYAAATGGAGPAGALLAAGKAVPGALLPVARAAGGAWLAPRLGELAGAEYTPSSRSLQTTLGGLAGISPGTVAKHPLAVLGLAAADNLAQRVAERDAGTSVLHGLTHESDKTVNRLKTHFEHTANKPFWQRALGPLSDPSGWVGDLGYIPRAIGDSYSTQMELDPKASGGKLMLRAMGVTRPPLPEGVHFAK